MHRAILHDDEDDSCHGRETNTVSRIRDVLRGENYTLANLDGSNAAHIARSS
jgi:hypothetical protein